MFVRKSTHVVVLAERDAARRANAALIKRNGELLLKIEQLKASRPSRGDRGRYVAVRQGNKIVRVPAEGQG